MRRFALLFVAPALLVLALQALPLALGARTLYLRDVMNAHLPLKAAQAEALRHGELPLVDLYRGGGQPGLGNPNGLPLYPDNLLLLVADPLWVVNAHFWIHWLLAPFAMAWLGRRMGLSPAGAGVAGVLYASGGYFLSLLNFYNLVALGALAPATLAAGLDATRRPEPGEEPSPWRWPRLGLLLGLVLLAGDPYSAVLTLLLLALALGLRDGARSLLKPPRELPAALFLAFLLSLPIWVELLRILPVSTRLAMREVSSEAMNHSLAPVNLVEGLFPLFFGRFDASFWGVRLYDSTQPFLVSIFPGILALSLLPLALRRGDGGLAHKFGWAATAIGLFGALGRFNPVMVLVYQLPGLGLLRFPVKLLLFSAIGLALLGGLAAGRLVESAGRWVFLRVALLAFAAAYGAYFAFYLWRPASFAGLLLTFDPGLPPDLLVLQPGRLATTALVLTATALASVLGTLLARRAAGAALALLLLVQAASQVTLLESLIETDDAAFYRSPPPLAAELPKTARLVHAALIPDSFGPLNVDPGDLPDRRSLWRARCNHEALASPTGTYHGFHYELNFSPERLDTFYSYFFATWLRERSDAERVRGLAAAGVDLILLPRALAGVPPEDARLLREFTTTCNDPMKVYQVERPLPPLALLGEVRRAPSAAAAVALTVAPDFDPRRTAVLPRRPDSAETSAAPGTILDWSETGDGVIATVDSPGGGVVTTRRPFLPIYRAEIDGEPATPVLLNGHRLGLEVPAGRRRVVIHTDRRPTAAAFAAALAALATLVAWGLRTPRGR